MIRKHTSAASTELTSTEKLVKWVALHITGPLGSLSCIIPSLDHLPMSWLLQNAMYRYIRANVQP